MKPSEVLQNKKDVQPVAPAALWSVFGLLALPLNITLHLMRGKENYISTLVWRAMTQDKVELLFKLWVIHSMEPLFQAAQKKKV